MRWFNSCFIKCPVLDSLDSFTQILLCEYVLSKDWEKSLGSPKSKCNLLNKEEQEFDYSSNIIISVSL